MLGFGGESLGVAQAKLVMKYFTKDLGTSLSLNLLIARLGSVLNDILSPTIVWLFNHPHDGTIAAVWTGFAFCFFCSLPCAFISAYMHSLRAGENCYEPLLNDFERQSNISYESIKEDVLEADRLTFKKSVFDVTNLWIFI